MARELLVTVGDPRRGWRGVPGARQRGVAECAGPAVSELASGTDLQAGVGRGRGGPAGDVGRGLVSRAGPGPAAAAPVTTPRPPQLVRYSAEGLLQLGPLGSTTFLPDSKCLVDDGRARTPALKKCEDVSRPAQRLWDFAQVSGDPAGPWGADGSGGPA